jgi:hypothetical protein
MTFDPFGGDSFAHYAAQALITDGNLYRRKFKKFIGECANSIAKKTFNKNKAIEDITHLVYPELYKEIKNYEEYYEGERKGKITDVIQKKVAEALLDNYWEEIQDKTKDIKNSEKYGYRCRCD